MNSVKEVQIKDFSELTAMSDTDIFYIVSNGISYKISGSKIVTYIKDHPDLTNKYVLKVDIGTDVAPLNSGKKLDSAYIIFGKTENTVYNGADGAALEQSLSNHLSDITNPHKVTKEQVGLENVENKNSETIRGELTKENVVDALGFEPEIDGAYEQATAYTDAKILELINGAPETLDTLKEVADAISEHSEIVDALNSAIGKKADQVELDTHTGNSTIHVTQIDKDNISTAISHANSAHARMDATKTEKSNINGNVKINDTETVVYEHPLSGVTAGTYRQITVDANGHVTGGNNTALPLTQGGTGATTAAQALSNLGLTATADEINKLDGAIVSTDEINYLSGTTSNIQKQINNKANSSHGNHVPDISSATSGNFLKSNGVTSEWGALTADEISTALGYVPGTGSNIITAVKGDAETEYQTGEYNITPAKIGLGNVDNTHDNEKAVLSASKLTTARKIGNASFNGATDITLEQIADVATQSSAGWMSSIDKEKLDNADYYATNIPFIAGTQTVGTSTWVGTTSEISELVDGQTIRYWLPYSSGSRNATLNLTLKDGTTTGAINCYKLGANRLSTQYTAGSIITMTYRENVAIAGSGSYTGWWANADYNVDTYDRVRYAQAIKCGTTAIANDNIIVGSDGLFQHLKLGRAFDVTYPILYASSSISASATGTNNYMIIPCGITTTQSITLTAYKPVFIKGSLSGTIFTPISTAPLTQTVPTSADGYEYILLGIAYSTTHIYLLADHPIFAYKGGAFRQTIQGVDANEIVSTTEPTDQPTNGYWLKPL